MLRDNKGISPIIITIGVTVLDGVALLVAERCCMVEQCPQSKQERPCSIHCSEEAGADVNFFVQAVWVLASCSFLIDSFAECY